MSSSEEKDTPQAPEGVHTEMPDRGLQARGFHALDDAFDYGLRVVYWGTVVEDRPVFDGTVSQVERNARIYAAYLTGTPVPDLVREYRISSQRVYQILQDN